MSKISGYGALTAPDPADLLLAVDVSDTSMAATGTDKQVTVAAVLGATRPWQFRVADYGANGDGKIGTGGTGTSGSTTFTDTGAAWVNAGIGLGGDIGKLIVVNQGTGGGSTTPLCTTISAVNSATSVTLSAALAANAASAPYVYGSDQVTAINAAITAAQAYANAHGCYTEVLCDDRIYCLGALTQSTSPRYNTHLPVPFNSETGQRLDIQLVGAGWNTEPVFWLSTTPYAQGTVLMSCVFATGQPNATYGQQSIVGGPTSTAGVGSGNFANTLLISKGIAYSSPWNSQVYGLDGRFLAQMDVPRGRAIPFAPVNSGAATVGGPYLTLPTNTVSVGFAFPGVLNNDESNIGWVTAYAMGAAVQGSEHLQGAKITALACNAALSVTDPAGAHKHGITIQHLSAEQCNYCVQTPAGATGAMPIHIGLCDVEFNATAHVDDPASVLYGQIRLADTSTSNTHPVMNGGNNLILLDAVKFSPGIWSGAPAAPASGVAQQNTPFHYATIWARATTSITSFAVGPQSGSMTSVTVNAGANTAVPIRVPPGWWWSAAYSGTLTAPWQLD